MRNIQSCLNPTDAWTIFLRIIILVVVLKIWFKEFSIGIGKIACGPSTLSDVDRTINGLMYEIICILKIWNTGYLINVFIREFIDGLNQRMNKWKL